MTIVLLKGLNQLEALDALGFDFKFPTKFNYSCIKGFQLKAHDYLRDLGVQLSSNLSFNIHIENTVTAASRIAGWGLMIFCSRCRTVMLTILKSLVQHRLDYCFQLRSPSDQGTINKIESIQSNLVNRLNDDNLNSLNYWEKLQELQLYSQERRRERYQVIFLRKICQGLVSGYDVEFTSGGTRRDRLGVPKIVSKNCPAVVRRARVFLDTVVLDRV